VRLARQALLPAGQHVLPQHAGQQNAAPPACPRHAAVGVQQRGLDEGLLGALDHHVQQRVDAAGQPQLPELLDAGQRVAGLQQLEHLVEQAALRHLGQQRPALLQRLGGLGLEREAQARAWRRSAPRG
jgi:hypothetical protein